MCLERLAPLRGGGGAIRRRPAMKVMIFQRPNGMLVNRRCPYSRVILVFPHFYPKVPRARDQPCQRGIRMCLDMNGKRRLLPHLKLARRWARVEFGPFVVLFKHDDLDDLFGRANGLEFAFQHAVFNQKLM